MRISFKTVFLSLLLSATSTNLWAQTPQPPGCAYVANYGTGGSNNTVSAYKIDTATGALTIIGTFTTGMGPRSVTVDPSGRFLYVADSQGVLGPALFLLA